VSTNQNIARSVKTVRCDSFGEFIQRAKVVPAKQDSSSSRCTKYQTRGWAGVDLFDDAVKLAETGWAEGAAKALALRGSIDSAVRQIVSSRQSQFVYDLTGDVVDVGKYLGGEPECFLTTEQNGESSSGSIVKLVANLAASGAVSTESLFARGAVILAAIDILESLGHRVELWIAKGSLGERNNAHQTFALAKPASQPLDADRIAFALCHAACLRKLAFSIMEQHGHLPNDTYPYKVTFDDPSAIVTDEAYRGTDFSQSELLDAVASLCEKCGISIPVDEIRELTSEK
jgi:hypothetical protein